MISSRIGFLRSGAPTYSPLGYTRLWCLTEKASGNVTGTAASDTGKYAVKWWDNTTSVYNNGATFSKAAAGKKAFDIYPVRGYIVDESGESHDATFGGDAQISATNGQAGFGSSVLLDGSGDYLNVGRGADFQFWGSEDWTIEMWIRPTNVSNYAPLFLSALRLNLHIYFSNTLYLNDATTGSGGLVISDALTINAWQHVAVVRQGTTSSVYVNGVRVGTGTVPYGTGSGNVEIGGSPSQPAYMSGNLDEVRVVRGTAIYSGASFTPPTGPLSNVTGTVLLLHCDGVEHLPSGQFDGFDISINSLTQVRAEDVSIASAAGYWQSGTYYWTNGTYYWQPGAYVPGAFENGILSDNALSAAALNQFYTDLDGGSGALWVGGNPGITADTPTIATGKGYTVYGSVPPSTTLLLNFNGSNGSTTFTDSSPSNLTVTSYGVQISTAQSKWGGSSAYFNGSSYLSISDGTFKNFGVDDFTVECWLRIDQTQSSNQYLWDMGSNQGVVQVLNDYGSSGPLALTWNTTPVGGDVSITSNEWHHIAMVRESGTTSLFIDGAFVDSAADAGSYGGNTLKIGNYGGGGSYYLHGYIDDFRIVKGAVYRAAFTPPTSQLGVYP